MNWFDDEETPSSIGATGATEIADDPNAATTLGGDETTEVADPATEPTTIGENAEEAANDADNTPVDWWNADEANAEQGKEPSDENGNSDWWNEDNSEKSDKDDEDDDNKSDDDEDDDDDSEDDDKSDKDDDDDDKSDDDEEDDTESDDDKSDKDKDDKEDNEDWWNCGGRKGGKKKSKKRNCNCDGWWNEDGSIGDADPAGALEADVDNGDGTAETAEPPADAGDDVGGGVDTEATNATDNDEKGNTDWWNEDPAGALEEQPARTHASPAEAPADRKGGKKKSKKVRNWWDDVEEPEGVPEAAEPVDTPEGVCPDGCADPGDDVEHTAVVETPQEDQPSETAEQMLSDILNTRIF